MVNTELYHHGIKGQKWGRRRFQNKDGTLTPAGKKRYDNEYMRLKEEKKVLTNKKRTDAKLQKLDDMQKFNDELRKELEGDNKSKSGNKASEPEKPKGISDLSTEELRARTERMRAEKDYINAQMELSKLQPEKVSAGRKFVENVIKNNVVPAAVDVGKKSAEGYLKKKLGLDNSTADALKKESERLKREADDWTNKKRADQAKEYFRQKEKSKEDSSENKKDDEPETVKTSGKDVSGEGTSKFTGFDSYPPPKDVVWDGQKYVDSLLGLPDPDRRIKHSDEDFNELYHYGVKGMKWGRGKSKAQRDARKLANIATKYYESSNRFNTDIDTGVSKSYNNSDLNKYRKKTERLVSKLNKRYASVSAIPEFDKNGYIVKSVEASITKLDRQGRIKSTSKSSNPVTTYDHEFGGSAEGRAYYVKKKNQIMKKYDSKLKNAKDEFDRMELEDEMEREIGSITIPSKYVDKRYKL